jgi:hypothetical protein
VGGSEFGGQQPPTSARMRGFLLGASVWVAFFAVLLAGPATVIEDLYLYYEDSGTALGAFMEWLALSLPLLGYVAAIVLTVRRSTRRLGQGMLIGLTLILPLAFVITIGMAVSQSS